MKSTLTSGDLRALFAMFSRVMEDNRELLTDLDAATGDGDLGITMSKGFSAATVAVQGTPEADISRLLLVAGSAIAKSAPSTLGTLIASGFMKASKEVTGVKELSLPDCARMMNGVVQGIIDRGKSRPGDKTIIDALYPAAEALLSTSPDLTLAQGWTRALNAAEKGLENTKAMRAQHGRAAYYGEGSVGKPDPGATVGVLLVKTIADFVHDDNLDSR